MARRKKTEEQLRKIHEEALLEFNDIQSAMREERLQCLQDRRFYLIAGAQWEDGLGDQFQSRPTFEFNKTHLAVIRIINEYRNNRITVDFTPRDGSEDEMADVCDGLYRADEKSCTANEAYDTAFEEGVGGGFGAWRVRACYEDEDDDENDKQRIVIEPITDADSNVFFDLNAKRQDKADAKRCFVLTSWTRRAYEEEFKDDPKGWEVPASMPRQVSQAQFDWCTPDLVWVCELYRIEESTEMVHFFRGLDDDAEDMRVTATELEADPDMAEELRVTGFREVRQKKVKTRRVHKYIMSGGKILEDCGELPGRCIPIIPFFAKRQVVDGVERCCGHVRLAKDAQRLLNMLLSWLADMAARFDIEKPIFTPEQIAGHANDWARDSVDKLPYLLSNAMKDPQGFAIPGTNAPAAYTKAPNVPPAMAALAQMATQMLTDLLGNQQAGEQLQPNLSGKAVELIQQRLDMQVFIYMSNLAKSMKRCGEVWLSMMKDIVVEDSRRMKTVDADGVAGSVVMNEPAYDTETGEHYTRNDITKATFEVDVDVGPSSTSARSAVVRALTGVATITDDPQTKQALTFAIIANLEGEGLGDLRDWARAKAIRMGLMKPNDEEKEQLAQEQANAKPDPQQQLLQAAAEQASADAQASRASAVQKVADANLKQAQTEKTLAEVMTEHQDQQIAGAEALQQILAGTQQPQPQAPMDPAGAF
jgi:hypothetical protein